MIEDEFSSINIAVYTFPNTLEEIHSCKDSQTMRFMQVMNKKNTRLKS